MLKLMKVSRSVSILGGGWLGLPLGLHLLKHRLRVCVSTTTLAKQIVFEKLGLNSSLINLDGTENPIFNHFFESEILIVCFPPKIRGKSPDLFFDQIKQLIYSIKENKGCKKIIFISSTSVYADTPGLKFEADAEPSHPLTIAEQMIFNQLSDYTIIIIRAGGLMGYDRNPCKYFGIREFKPNTRVNYVHRDDVVNIVSWLSIHINSNLIVNLCAPLHPTRGQIAEQVCNLKIDSLVEDLESFQGKIVDVTLLQSIYTEKFLFPDPLKFKYL
jgi:nucleoside-diphosphate-sugar epimerase